MPGNLEPPDEIWGFGSWLLWIIATRARALVDACYEARRAHATKEYGWVEGHGVPTPSLVAWLLVAAQLGLSPLALPPKDPEVKRRQHSLRVQVNRAIRGEPQVFRVSWLHDLAAICELTNDELEFLKSNREDMPREKEQWAKERTNLHKAIAHSFGSRPEPGARASGTVPAPRTLPPNTPWFKGRKPQLRRLTAAVARSDEVTEIYAIDGMPGVGKTALAVHAANQLSSRYPDGQIFMDLHGHTPGQRPVRPEDSLVTLLLFTGMDPRWIPGDLDARAALWRSRLKGKKVLLLLDDAASSQQVRPLLPGAAGTRVLVTSRRRLTGLDAGTLVTLGALPPREAVALFIKLAGRPHLKPADRAVTEIVRLCGYLPAAIGLTAGKLAHHPAWTVADLVTALTTTQDRLSHMEAENFSLASAFELSFRDLTADQQSAFRRLGLHPGSLLDAYATAALADTDVAIARRYLDALYADHLIEEVAAGRFRFHDLIREYARILAAADDIRESRPAVDRLLDYYLHAAVTASRHLARREAIPGTLPASLGLARLPEISSRDQAMAWLETELPSLRACVEYCAAHARSVQAVQIVAALSEFLRDQGHWDQALALHGTAVTVAHAAGDRIGEANARNNMGVMQRLAGDLAAAVDSHQQASRLFVALGHLDGQARTLTELGVAFRLADDYAASTASLTEALRLYGDLGDRQGMAEARSHLGFIQFMTGEHEASIRSLTEALQAYGDLDDRPGQAEALSYLGTERRISGDYPAATVGLTEALRLFRDLGNRQGQANALNNLGVVQRISGDYPAATVSLAEALRLFRDLGNRQGQANALNSLGVVQRITGELATAADLHRQALELYSQLGVRLGQANALNFLGAVQRLTGDYTAATSGHEQALQIARDLCDRQAAADTLNFLGTVQQLVGDSRAAAASQSLALEAYSELGDQQGRADALNCLGHLQLAADDYQSAAASLSQAFELYRQLGSKIGQAQALINLGQMTDKQPASQAGAQYTQAMSIARDIGAPFEEARALEGLGLHHIQKGNQEEGAALLRQAHAIYQHMQVPDRQRVETLLDHGIPPGGNPTDTPEARMHDDQDR